MPRVKSGSELDTIAEILARGDCFRAECLPILRLEDEKPVAFELVSRGPEGPYKMPDDFFRLSNERDIRTRVDLHCLSTCAEQADKMKNAGRVHINIFPQTIMETQLDTLISALPKSKLSGSLVLEINERPFHGDLEVLNGKILALKKAGAIIALDDVGYGISSLETILELEPEILKIDRRYVDGVSKDARKETRLRKLVKVAKSLDLELVAEGIETRADLEVVKSLDIKSGQGSLWTKVEA